MEKRGGEVIPVRRSLRAHNLRFRRRFISGKEKKK
jgi:hypothetical protein